MLGEREGEEEERLVCVGRRHRSTSSHFEGDKWLEDRTNRQRKRLRLRFRVATINRGEKKEIRKNFRL
jgi:hypothetical protein